METQTYFSTLKETVEAARGFVQAEHKKRVNRFKPIVEQVSQAFELNDYIEMFQVTSGGDLYDGDQNILTQFEDEWEQVLERVKPIATNIEEALDIMKEDIDDIVQKLKSLSVEDESFHRRVKQELVKLIEHVIVAIRDGWSTNPQAYERLLQPIQQLLSDLGVYTITISVGDDIDYDVTEPQQSSENITTDETLIDKVKEVQLYPYVYGHDKMPFIAGHVIGWRKG